MTSQWRERCPSQVIAGRPQPVAIRTVPESIDAENVNVREKRTPATFPLFYTYREKISRISSNEWMVPSSVGLPNCLL